MSGVSLRHEGRAHGGSYDVQWHTVDDDGEGDDHEFVNLVYDGTYHRLITSAKSRSQQSVGEYVCKYGRATRRTCGNIASKNHQLYSPYGGNVWIRVHKDGVNLSSVGDSGTAVTRPMAFTMEALVPEIGTPCIWRSTISITST